MNVAQLPSGTWRARVYLGKVEGKSQYQTFLGPTKKEAEMQALEFQIAYERNPQKAFELFDITPKMEAKVAAMPTVSYEKMTVGEAIDAYIRSLDGVISGTTTRRYKADRKKFFQPLMDIKLRDLTQPVVQTVVSLESKRYAPKSIHCAHGLLSAAVSMYRPDLTLKTNLPQLPEPDVYIPEEADIQRLLKHVEGKWIEIPILLGACAGMRRSEICGLQFKDVDKKKNTISIRRTMVKDDSGKWIVQERTKTVKSKREILLPAFLIEKLLSMPRTSEFIVGRVPDSVSKDFIDARNAVGLKCRFHDLRHFNASVMLAMGVPDKYAMERMGYSTPATLKKVYQHTMSGKRQEVNQMINSHMDSLFSDTQSASKPSENV